MTKLFMSLLRPIFKLVQVFNAPKYLREHQCSLMTILTFLAGEEGSTISRHFGLALSWQVSKTDPPVCWLVRPPSAKVSLPRFDR